MTTPQLTPQQLKAVAERVYSEFRWLINGRLSAWGLDLNVSSLLDGQIFRITPGGDRVLFNPSLTGSDMEKAQALDTIMAIDNYGPAMRIQFRMQLFNEPEIDILTAAMLAILEATK